MRLHKCLYTWSMLPLGDDRIDVAHVRLLNATTGMVNVMQTHCH